MNELHLQTVAPAEVDRLGVLTLPKSEYFEVTIAEYWEELNLCSNEKSRAAVKDKYNKVEWVWCILPLKRTLSAIYKQNVSLKSGLDKGGIKTLYVPEFLVGGGLLYAEAFFPEEVPVGRYPSGLYVKATGTPTFLRAQWTDFAYLPIEGRELAFGSEVLLHIYTAGLYGEEIEVKLFDYEFFFGNERVNISDGWAFTRRVDIHEMHDFEIGKTGSGGTIYKDDKGSQVHGDTHIQKVVIKVKIDHHWANLAGSFLLRDKLDLFAKVYHNGKLLAISEKEAAEQLKIRKDGTLYDDPQEITNQPVLVDDYVDNFLGELKSPVDFTIGVFFDGTLNNLYNTELRMKVDESRTGEALVDATGFGLTDKEAKDVYRKRRGNKVFNNPKEGSSSYESGLSNPAILFKNYEITEKSKTLKIYVEGIGTHSAPKQQGQNLEAEDYRNDDFVWGPAFGIGSAGIIEKVRQAIRDIRSTITNNISKKNEVLGALTFDVFGFSRGAAAARHFVHVVKHEAYKPKQYDENVWDLHGEDLDSKKYLNQLMPEFGYLGQLLQEAALLDLRTRVVIRFVGIYDTVPHHGLFQWNDIEHLGLDDVNKANYVVHMVAADEHRSNFSLVDISSVRKVAPESEKKGGIEVSYPGVHSDVGGSYVEGWPTKAYKLETTLLAKDLELMRQELIHKGWFNEFEASLLKVFVRFRRNKTKVYQYHLQVSKERLSSQYSFIPLHLMEEICAMRKVAINKDKLLKFYDFQENWITDNVAFLERVKARLRKQTFEGGNPFVFKDYEAYQEPGLLYDTGVMESQEAWQKRQEAVQENLKAKIDKENEDIKFLRMHYLHWNSSNKGINAANIVSGKRKRKIR
ncbi:T6SS phospholipase effector Tle1-like catalytic domain-containing protein [Sphingobacterium sp. MYb382]|uniref:T6SS phospholipase effector Tle1-like catalytic domain-containing protein n=1 Tax=Sphingobacterium sp. MYb382 TaxID=2745278 RepID=UPI0030951B35